MKSKLIDWIMNVEAEKVRQRSTIWNLIASVINAGYSAILMFFIGRIVGMSELGAFSISSAYAYQCLSIGAFGVRNVQASDVTKEYGFSDYFYLRILSSIGMYMLLLYYTFFQDYTYEKMGIILVFGLFKSIEAFEDLYHGEYQRYDRLDIGCILQATRYIISLVVFVVVLLVMKSLVVSLFVSTVFTTILCYIQNASIIHKFVIEKLTFNTMKVRQLFLICLPLCFSNIISTYIVNLPKYAIDKMSDDILQSHYGILILPVVTINLLSAVIYRPVINSLSRDYYEQNYHKFFREIMKQTGIIMALTIGITGFGYIFGLQILGTIYGVDLNAYMSSFIIMLVGGGINTITVFLTIVLTVQRAQNKLLVAYILTIVIGIPISYPLVSALGISGAAYLYLILSICMTLLFVCLIYITFMKHKQLNYNRSD